MLIRTHKNRFEPILVRTWLVIGFMKQHVVEFPPVNHFSAFAAFVEMSFL
jgi:hypothetical protein